ncbi:MAG: hypothetical protein M1150_01390 [Patescibacteria group bacterium]|nr:hypothetical protein [Patescibacteria group bacterium]
MEENISNQPVNPKETTTQPTSNSINNQRGNTLILLGVLFLLLVVGGGAYYLGTRNQSNFQNSPQSTPTPTVKPSQDLQVTSNQSGIFEKSQIVFEKDIPSSNKKLIVFNTKNNIEGFDSELYATNSTYNRQSAKKIDVKLVSIAKYEAFVSPSSTKSYVVLNSSLGDGQEFYVIESDGNLIGDEIIKINYKAIGYGVKFGCQCETSFKEWNDNTHFTLKIVNGTGEEYEILVDAATGKVNESSFKKIK